MDPLSATAQILGMLQQNIPQLVAALHSVTPDGRAAEIVADMRRSARELAGCAEAGVLTQERMQLINSRIDAYVIPHTTYPSNLYKFAESLVQCR